MNYFYILLLCIPTIYAMENPKDDAHDQELTDAPTTGTRTTSSSASSKSVSRVPTLLESMNSNTGSIISSHHQLPGLHKSTAIEVSGEQAKLFEKDVESVVKYYVDDKSITPAQGELIKNMLHIQGKMFMSMLIGVNHGIIHDRYGSKEIHQFFSIEYEDISQDGTFRPQKLKNSFKDVAINPLLKEIKTTRRQLCYWILGTAVTNALFTAVAFSALYLK